MLPFWVCFGINRLLNISATMFNPDVSKSVIRKVLRKFEKIDQGDQVNQV